MNISLGAPDSVSMTIGHSLLFLLFYGLLGLGCYFPCSICSLDNFFWFVWWAVVLILLLEKTSAVSVVSLRLGPVAEQCWGPWPPCHRPIWGWHLFSSWGWSQFVSIAVYGCSWLFTHVHVCSWLYMLSSHGVNMTKSLSHLAGQSQPGSLELVISHCLLCSVKQIAELLHAHFWCKVNNSPDGQYLKVWMILKS